MIAPSDPAWGDADAACREVYASSASEWADDAVYIWLEPRTLFAFASDPSTVE